jgi:hypothetical protein
LVEDYSKSALGLPNVGIEKIDGGNTAVNTFFVVASIKPYTRKNSLDL